MLLFGFVCTYKLDYDEYIIQNNNYLINSNCEERGAFESVPTNI